MWCRALLAAVTVTCMLTRVHTQDTQGLDQIKDLLSVFLKGIQKEDLEENTLQKLQRSNVNIHLNNEELRNKCPTFKLIEIKHINTTKEYTGIEDGQRLRNETQNLVFNEQKGKKNKDDSRLSSLLSELKKNNYVVNDQENKNISNISDTQRSNCNEITKYNESQPKLNTIINFWKNCVTVNKLKNNYKMQYNLKTVSIYTNESDSKKRKKWLDLSNKNFSETDDNFTQSLFKQENTEDMKQISPKKIDIGASYHYTPPSKYKNDHIENNILGQLKLNNQNLRNEHANDKVMPKGLMQYPYTVFNNYNSLIFNKTQNIKRDRNKYYEIPEGNISNSLKDEESSKNLSNNNFVYNENLPNKYSHPKELVGVEELAKFIHNIPIDKPNKYSYTGESANIDESVKNHNIADSSFSYQNNEPNMNIFERKSVKENDIFIPKIIPTVPRNNFLYDENISNTDPHKDLLIKTNTSPKFVHDIDSNLIYRKNEPNKDSFRKKLGEANKSPIISNIPDANLFYREEDSKKDKRNESIKVDDKSKIISNTKIIPNSIIMDIAESIKAIILRDLKKDLSKTTTIRSTVITTLSTRTTPMIPETEHTQNSTTTNDFAIQEAVMNKFKKFLEQLNILKNKPFNVKHDNFIPSNKNENNVASVLETSTIKNVDIFIEDKSTDKSNFNNQVTKKIDYNFVPQLHKNRSYVNTKLKKKREKVKKPQEKRKTGPIVFQTNSLEIRPLGIFMDKFQDPINQNIVLTTNRPNINEHSEIRTKMSNLKKSQNVESYFPKIARNTVSNGNSNEDYYSGNSDTNSKYNYKDTYQTYTERYEKNNVPNFYGSLENMNKLNAEPNMPFDRAFCCDRQYVSQLMDECCNERVVSRQQVSLNVKNRRYDDSHYKTFVKSQQKVNDMLEKILAAKNKFHSVEII